MSRRGKKVFSPPAAGGTSLLVVFAVLCFTVFALLSLSMVNAENKLSLESSQSVSEYYAADCRAQTILARLRNGEMPDEVMRDGNIYTFECPVSKTQKLIAKVQLENGRFSVLQWKTASSVEWHNNESLNLWKGAE